MRLAVRMKKDADKSLLMSWVWLGESLGFTPLRLSWDSSGRSERCKRNLSHGGKEQMGNYWGCWAWESCAGKAAEHPSCSITYLILLLCPLGSWVVWLFWTGRDFWPVLSVHNSNRAILKQRLAIIFCVDNIHCGGWLFNRRHSREWH